jgi:hypothetical protein
MDKEIKRIEEVKALLKTTSPYVVAQYLDGDNGIQWEVVESETHKCGVFFLFHADWSSTIMFHILGSGSDFSVTHYLENES